MTFPVATSISWAWPATTLPRQRPADCREVGGRALVSRDQGSSRGSEVELVVVLPEAVTGVNRSDGTVGAAGHLPDTGAAAACLGPSLPPGEQGLTVVVLGVEVVRGHCGERLEPDQPALPVQKHEPRLAGCLREGYRGDEDVAWPVVLARLAPITEERGDPHRGRLKVRPGDEALDLGQRDRSLCSVGPLVARETGQAQGCQPAGCLGHEPPASNEPAAEGVHDVVTLSARCRLLGIHRSPSPAPS